MKRHVVIVIRIQGIVYENIFLHAAVPTNPCSPSPCGPNSKCQNVNGLAVCTCLPNFMGNPPSCRAECVVNSQCSRDLACINQRCTSPCPDPCGINTQCKVINHSPICSCNLDYTGDPFIKCFPAPRKNFLSFSSALCSSDFSSISHHNLSRMHNPSRLNFHVDQHQGHYDTA